MFTSRKGPVTPAKPARGPARKQARKTGGVTMEVCLKVDSPKIREMEKRAAQRRGFKWGFGLIVGICLAALVKITVQESFLKNPQFELRHVAVETSGPLPVEKIVRATLLTRGENLLSVDLRAVHSRLRRLPAIEDLTVERDFDAGLMTLRVKQRQPVAWLDCPRLGLIAGRPEAGQLIDAQGVPFPCEVLTDALAVLPVIRYEALAQNTPGTAIRALPLRAALQILQALEQRFEQGQPQLRSLDIQTPYSMVASFTDRSQVTFGVDDLPHQLVRLDRVRQEARARRWEIATLNLLARQNVPVTFRQPPDLAGLQPAPVLAVPVASTHPAAAPVR